ncbi:MAG: hypothetical protein QXL91_03280 [Candidatus Bathyarchaeia archaeon]|nr:hypothetical protein [Candidatus Bathyarchaeota archaeon]
MMRTIEVFLVIIIITGAFIIASFYAVLPIPRRVSPVNLKRLALTTLQSLDADYNLSVTVFKPRDDPSWAMLQTALSALLPPNIVYNLTVYDVQSGSEGTIYVPYKSFSNAESLGIKSEAASYLVASSNVTFKVIPEKIGERSGSGITLYILNCSDARGWWITGYTAHSLAEDLYKLLSPYFTKTVIVQNTAQFAQILNNQSLKDETVMNAVLINTFGEAVPIPSQYCTAPYSNNNYAYYCYFLGQQVRRYNWTWVSIVGYPFYYVSNTIALKDSKNNWGIYGMKDVRQPGMYAFLQGLNNISYDASYSSDIYKSVGVVSLSPQVLERCNYYGIYPSPYQTSTRAIQKSKLDVYPNLVVGLLIFNEKDGCYPGAIYNHKNGAKIEGSLLALGLTRTPDIRLTAIGLLSYYQPRLYRSEFNVAGASKLVVLQLGQVGGT